VAAFVYVLASSCLSVSAAQAPNPSVDVAVLRQAAERGDLAAMSRLGGAYRDGAGVSRDLVEAHAWLAGAAMLATGADAQTYGAAVLHLAGRMTGAQLDDAEKRTFDGLQRLGAAGHPVAQFLVGTTYYKGERMASPDVVRAAEWLRKAANQGERRAQFMLATMHFTGDGVARDYVEAHKWASLAAARAQSEDQKQFADARDAFAQVMTPDQIGAAQKRAREWLEAFGKGR
jgi:TPR repeat protein